jgi:hypothetical protein
MITFKKRLNGLIEKWDGEIFGGVFEEHNTPILSDQYKAWLESGNKPDEEKEATEQKKVRIKNELILPRQNYLNDTRNDALEFLLQGKEYPKKSKREQAQKEIEEIKQINTLKELNSINLEFSSSDGNDMDRKG